MKVLFTIHDLGFADHIAVAHLSAVAKQLDHLTYFCSLDRDDLSAVVDQIKPDVVAYSVNVIGYRRTIEAHRRATETGRFISIMGGPHATISPETFSESGMDAYCVGEGEYAFRDFLTQVDAGDSFDGIPNLITRKVANPPRPLIGNLDELPMPDRDLVIASSFLKNAAKKTFYATRGCPFQCAYCCNNYYRELYRGKGPAVRRFSVERVIREIEDVGSKYRMDFVKFGDDCFTFKADEWLVEFADKYPKRVGLPFNCYLRIDTIDDAMLRLLREAGCFCVDVSVDSTSRYVRETILKRHMRSEDFAERLRRIREYGINTYVNYMLAAPGSTMKDDLDTIELSKKGRVSYAAYTTTVPMERTELYEYCVREGMIDPDEYQGDMSGCAEPSKLSCFSQHEKNVRYNVFLLGALLARLPFPLRQVGIIALRVIPPNIVFRKVFDWLYEYHMKHTRFKLPNDHQPSEGRVWKRARQSDL